MEVMEVHAINAVAPYIITSQLLPVMLSHSPVHLIPPPGGL